MPFDIRYGPVAATGDATLEISLRHGKPHASIFIHGVFGHQFESEPTGREGYLAAMLVEGGIARVEVLGVHFIGGKPQAFTKPLIMDDLTFPQEFDWVADIRVVYQAQDVVIGGPGLLFCYDSLKATEGLETLDSTRFFGYFDFSYATIA